MSTPLPDNINIGSYEKYITKDLFADAVDEDTGSVNYGKVFENLQHKAITTFHQIQTLFELGVWINDEVAMKELHNTITLFEEKLKKTSEKDKLIVERSVFTGVEQMKAICKSLRSIGENKENCCKLESTLEKIEIKIENDLRKAWENRRQMVVYKPAIPKRNIEEKQAIINIRRDLPLQKQNLFKESNATDLMSKTTNTAKKNIPSQRKLNLNAPSSKKAEIQVKPFEKINKDNDATDNGKRLKQITSSFESKPKILVEENLERGKGKPKKTNILEKKFAQAKQETAKQRKFAGSYSESIKTPPSSTTSHKNTKAKIIPLADKLVEDKNLELEVAQTKKIDNTEELKALKINLWNHLKGVARDLNKIYCWTNLSSAGIVLLTIFFETGFDERLSELETYILAKNYIIIIEKYLSDHLQKNSPDFQSINKIYHYLEDTCAVDEGVYLRQKLHKDPWFCTKYSSHSLLNHPEKEYFNHIIEDYRRIQKTGNLKIELENICKQFNLNLSDNLTTIKDMPFDKNIKEIEVVLQLVNSCIEKEHLVLKQKLSSNYSLFDHLINLIGIEHFDPDADECLKDIKDPSKKIDRYHLRAIKRIFFTTEHHKIEEENRNERQTLCLKAMQSIKGCLVIEQNLLVLENLVKKGDDAINFQVKNKSAVAFEASLKSAIKDLLSNENVLEKLGQYPTALDSFGGTGNQVDSKNILLLRSFLNQTIRIGDILFDADPALKVLYEIKNVDQETETKINDLVIQCNELAYLSREPPFSDFMHRK